MSKMDPIGCGWPCEVGAKRAPCNGGGGGGGSSSETSTTTQNVDKRQVVDTGSIGVSSDQSTVNVSASYLDDGAVNKAIDLAKSSTDGGNKNIGDVLGFAKDVLKVAGDNLKGTQSAFATATEKVSAAYDSVQEMSTGQRVLIAAVVGIAGVVAVKSFGKR